MEEEKVQVEEVLLDATREKHAMADGEALFAVVVEFCSRRKVGVEVSDVEDYHDSARVLLDAAALVV